MFFKKSYTNVWRRQHKTNLRKRRHMKHTNAEQIHVKSGVRMGIYITSYIWYYTYCNILIFTTKIYFFKSSKNNVSRKLSQENISIKTQSSQKSEYHKMWNHEKLPMRVYSQAVAFSRSSGVRETHLNS